MRISPLNSNNSFYILSQSLDSDSEDSVDNVDRDERRPSSPNGTAYPDSWEAPEVYNQSSSVGVSLLENRLSFIGVFSAIDLDQGQKYVNFNISKRSDYLDAVILIRDTRKKVEQKNHDLSFHLNLNFSVKHCHSLVKCTISFVKENNSISERHHVGTMGSYILLCQQYSILSNELNIMDAKIAQLLLHKKSLKEKDSRLKDIVSNLRVLLYSIETARDPGFFSEMIIGLEKMADNKLTFFDLFFDKAVVEGVIKKVKVNLEDSSLLRAGVANGFELKKIFSKLQLCQYEIDNILKGLERKRIIGKVCINIQSNKFSYFLINSKDQRNTSKLSESEKIVLSSLDILLKCMNKGVNKMQGTAPFSMVHKHAVSAVTLMNQFTNLAEELSPKKALTFFGPGIMAGKENTSCGHFINGVREPGKVLFKALNGHIKQIAYSAMKSPPMSLPVQSRLAILNEEIDFQSVSRYFDVKVKV